ncbi:LL-diaminopimelate aminotransferase [Calidifontibacillus oryziterrae]|uniref:LL-diaminopimelate aminotransferase n=1 Tax=Calidifontibacillus oryziterrae TaxID=1191699 RepID=UPI0002D2ABE6|nr:LL-diaminopimelate aminotransferase [Calidifontibacillus oryziterrae]
MIIPTSQLMQSFETSIFSELAAFKQAKIQQGIQMIDLSIGSPDLPPPKFIVDALVESVKDPKQYGYTLKGTTSFNAAVLSFYEKHYGVTFDPKSEIVQLMGSQDGLLHLPMALVDQDDIILVPDPGYTAYGDAVRIAKAKAYTMPLLKENNFLPNLENIPAQIAEKAKMMILNFPGNPVPALANRTFFEKVVAFAKKHNIVVVHDFAYSELVFDGEKPISFLEIEGAKDIGVEFNSLSKSYNMAGCRIAYMIGNADIVATLAKLKSNVDYGVFLPIQNAAIVALLEGDSFLQENCKRYEARRDVLVDGLREIGWDVARPPATMFVWAEIPAGYSSKQFAYDLIEKAGVVVTPGSAFGEAGEGFVRIALVQSEDVLKEAVRRIKQSGIFNGSMINNSN